MTTGKGTGRLEAEAPDARRSRQSAGSDAAAAGSELGGRGGVVGRRAVGRRALGAVARAADDGGDICVWDGASCPRAPGPTRLAAAAAAPTGACLSGWWALARLWRDNSLDAASSRRPSAGCGGRRGSTGSSSFCAARRCASGASTSDGGALVGQPSIGPPPPPPPRLRAVRGTLHSLLDAGSAAACVAGSARLPAPDVVFCINSGMGTLPHRWLRRGFPTLDALLCLGTPTLFSCFNRHEAAGEAALLPLLGAEVLLSYSTPNPMAHALPFELIATAEVPARASPSADADADADALAELAARAAASTALEAGGSEAGALPAQLP